MRLIQLLVTCIPLCTFTGVALWCLAHGHSGFAVAFIVFAFLATPKISVGGGTKGDAK